MQWRLIEIIFPREIPHPDKYLYETDLALSNPMADHFQYSSFASLFCLSFILVFLSAFAFVIRGISTVWFHKVFPCIKILVFTCFHWISLLLNFNTDSLQSNRELPKTNSNFWNIYSVKSIFLQNRERKSTRHRMDAGALDE